MLPQGAGGAKGVFEEPRIFSWRRIWPGFVPPQVLSGAKMLMNCVLGLLSRPKMLINGRLRVSE